MRNAAYIASLREAFLKQHGCNSVHIKTVPVIERRNVEAVWNREVEVFDLVGHPEAFTGYAWVYDRAKGGEIMTVLGLPPITSAIAAVEAVILDQLKK